MIAILIPTFPKYKELSLQTKREIQKLWKEHPPIFLAGCKESSKDWLPCENERANWVEVFLEAITELKRRNYTKVYVILDDHPPIRKCSQKHLNQTLPRFMDEVNATNIGLRGVGQSTRIPTIPSTKISSLSKYFKNTDPSYKYIFSLHPSLWNLDKLIAITETLIDDPNEPSETAWNWEKRSSYLPGVPQEWKDATYQVIGRKLSENRALFFFQQVLKTFARITYLHKLPLFDSLWAYYEGPYPIVFAGIKSRGKLNHYYANYVKLFKLKQLIDY